MVSGKLVRVLAGAYRSVLVFCIVARLLMCSIEGKRGKISSAKCCAKTSEELCLNCVKFVYVYSDVFLCGFSERI